MYDSVAGRFASRDPAGFTDGLSIYSTYMQLSNLDPSGMCNVVSSTSNTVVVTVGAKIDITLSTSTTEVNLPGQKPFTVPDVSPKILDIAVIMKVTCAKVTLKAVTFECKCDCDKPPVMDTKYSFSFTTYEADLNRVQGVTIIKLRLYGVGVNAPGLPSSGHPIAPFLPLPGIEGLASYWTIHPNEMKFAEEACKSQAPNEPDPVPPSDPTANCD